MPRFFTRITQGFLKSRFMPRQRSDVIVIGIGLLGVVLTALLAVGGYALSLSHASDAVPAPSAPAATALKEQDIDAALEVLSEREEALQALLSGGSPHTTTTTSQQQ